MKKFKIYLIPNTHSDLQYLKSYQEYLPLHLSNLKEGLDILERHTEYTYLTEHTSVLEVFWKRFPQYREKIKKFAAEGRLEIPSSYCISDMNIPSGESLIQQIYYAKKWTKKHLGTESKTAWIADSFGLNWQLPQILKGCACLYCAFVRGIDNPERKSEFLWQGLDETKILTQWLVLGYGGIGPFSNNAGSDFEKLADYINESKKHSSSSLILLGNGGDFAKPSELSCYRVNAWNKTKNDKIIFSTPTKYFNDLLEAKNDLELVKGEFNPVFKGCYSGRIKLKQINRLLENKISAVEKIAVLALFSGKPCPFTQLDNAWKKILFFQFHDSICGTVTDSAYKEILRGYKKAEDILNKLLRDNIDFLSGGIGSPEKVAAVFNPLCWERRDLVKIESDDLQVRDEHGKLIPCQRVEENGAAFTIFIATTHSLGYKTFVSTVKKKHFTGNTFKIKDNQIENSFYKIKLSDNGVITSLIHKVNNFEHVDQRKPFFNNLTIQDDNGDLWLLYDGPLRDSLGKGFASDNMRDPMPDPGGKTSKNEKRHIGFISCSAETGNKVEVIERGPVRLTVRIKGILSFWRIRVLFTQYIYMYNDMERIDFKTEIISFGRHFRIRTLFPTSIKDGEIYHEIPFGNIKRPEGEFPAQNWMAYGDRDKGLVLLNKGLPGNNVTDGVMMLSLMRSTAMEYKCSSEMAFEEGVKHSFDYSIIPYTNRSFSSFAKRGMEFNNLFICRLVGYSKEKSSKDAAFVETVPGNVILSTLRKIGDGVLIRIYEAEGRKSECKIKFSEQLRFGKAEETDFLGKTKNKKMKINNNFLKFSLLPYQIKTLKIT